MSVERAVKILAKSEAELRALVSSAADSGDYDAVLRITSWAKQISTMAGGTASPAGTKELGAASTRKSLARGGYPRFVRRGNRLVKFGWSKREKREYEQHARRVGA
jgi:hypothetical protein